MNMPDIPESITLPAAMSVLSTPKGLCFPLLSTLLNLLLGPEKTLILFCPVSLQLKQLLTHSLISPSLSGHLQHRLTSALWTLKLKQFRKHSMKTKTKISSLLHILQTLVLVHRIAWIPSRAWRALIHGKVPEA